ncbi:hypothetical protein B0H14DRAFT_2596471 [Mycena olivaceomarginata]|nr:hypothetical protein B0H14DRAFT_2596471 [Mycena olivaceomarginata]
MAPLHTPKAGAHAIFRLRQNKHAGSFLSRGFIVAEVLGTGELVDEPGRVMFGLVSSEESRGGDPLGGCADRSGIGDRHFKRGRVTSDIHGFETLLLQVRAREDRVLVRLTAVLKCGAPVGVRHGYLHFRPKEAFSEFWWHENPPRKNRGSAGESSSQGTGRKLGKGVAYIWVEWLGEALDARDPAVSRRKGSDSGGDEQAGDVSAYSLGPKQPSGGMNYRNAHDQAIARTIITKNKHRQKFILQKKGSRYIWWHIGYPTDWGNPDDRGTLRVEDVIGPKDVIGLGNALEVPAPAHPVGTDDAWIPCIA